MPTAIPYGNANKLNLISVVASPASVAANTTEARTFTVPGVVLGQDFVIDVTKPTEQAGLALGQSRISADNTITVVFINATAAPIVPTASETYTFGVVRRDGPAIGNMS
jgi:hypothetical protein